MDDGQTFDCFLSHNSKDKPAVRALADALRANGIVVWLDEEQLRPGLSAQKLMDSGIRRSRSVAVLVGADGIGPWEDEELQAALRLAVADKRPVIPVLLPDAPRVPTLPGLLATRTWVDLRPGAHPNDDSALGQLVWGITGHKPDARSHFGPDPDAPPKAGPDPRTQIPPPRAQAIREDAVAAIADSLDLLPALCAMLAQQEGLVGATRPAELARRLCAPDGDLRTAMRAFKTALPETARRLRQRQGDIADLRRLARDILGWLVVTAVLEGYDREDARLARAWFDGTAFQIPLGRSPCVEVLTACWRRGKAQFSTQPERFDYGEDDITPGGFGEIGFDDPKRLDFGRAVDYVWRRVYQKVCGDQAPARLAPAKIAVLRAWLDVRREDHRHRLRLVIDRYDLDSAYNFKSTLAAIHEAVPQIHLIVIDSGTTADPGVFVLPASRLAADIYDCLHQIEGLA
jgi:hypothetical protein